MINLAGVAATALLLSCCAAAAPDLDSSEGDFPVRRLVKRQVLLTQHSGGSNVRYTGLDPYEERLLIILLGSSIAILFAIVFLVICFRTYRIDRKAIGGGFGRGEGLFQQQM
uniref:FXYD domain-containing ion transport regulator n=1 Tax=Macrostomum lignano TaxID=282301 RepID=A0A1I8GRQ7_9PLAT